MNGLTREEADVLTHLRAVQHDTFVVASVGRLIRRKGLEIGLKAFAAFAAKHQEAGLSYWIIGQGPRADSLRKLADRLGCSDRVRFFGNVPHSELLGLYQHVSVLLHTALHEGFPAVPLEAMCAGIPVIALRIDGTAYFVPPEAGTLISVTDRRTNLVDKLASEVERLWSEPDTRCRMGESGRKVATQFTWDVVVERLHETLRDAASEV